MSIRRRNLHDNNKREIVIENGILKIRDLDGNTVFPTMIAHPNPDSDVAATFFALDLYKIKYGEVEFKSNSENGLVEEKTAEEWLRDGYILVDVGGNGEPEKVGGRLIHLDHSHDLSNKDTCATTICLDLIKRDMEAKPDELLIKLVNFVRRNDLRGGRGFLDFADICKVALAKLEDHEKLLYMKALLNAYINNKGEPNSELFCEIFAEFAEGKKNIPQKLLDYLKMVQEGKTQNIPDLVRVTNPEAASLVRLILEETYLSQMEYREAEMLCRRIKEVILVGGISLVSLETDNPQFHRAALSNGADIIAVKRSNGHVQIYTRKSKKGINLEDIVVAIRAEEACANGDQLPNLADLRRDGAFGVWYYFKAGGMLMNGSSTANAQRKTKLGFKKKVAPTIVAVQNGYMPYCKGRYPCSKECDLYLLNFANCRRYRATAENKGSRKGETLILAR
ncbi:MAG: hypothetical protein KAQ87_04535 [Candidatus Pacebacteria bacterium]|nr:hypothetical protein [Candidatus Paceibacterota bacterium]